MGTPTHRNLAFATPGEGRGAGSYLAFRAGGVLFGAPLERVVRVLRAVAVQPLPETPDHVLGVVNMQGDPVPVVDPARRLGVETGPVRAAEQFLLVHTGARLVAVRIQQAGEVFSAAGEAGDAGEGALWPGMQRIRRVVESGGEITLIHDPELFFTATDEEALKAALHEAAPDGQGQEGDAEGGA